MKNMIFEVVILGTLAALSIDWSIDAVKAAVISAVTVIVILTGIGGAGR